MPSNPARCRLRIKTLSQLLLNTCWWYTGHRCAIAGCTSGPSSPSSTWGHVYPYVAYHFLPKSRSSSLVIITPTRSLGAKLTCPLHTLRRCQYLFSVAAYKRSPYSPATVQSISCKLFRNSFSSHLQSRYRISGLPRSLESRSLPGGISGSMSKNSWIFAAAPMNGCSSSLRIFHIAGDDLYDRRQWAVEPLAAAEALRLIWG